MNWTESSLWLNLRINNSLHTMILLVTITLLYYFRRLEASEFKNCYYWVIDSVSWIQEPNQWINHSSESVLFKCCLSSQIGLNDLWIEIIHELSWIMSFTQSQLTTHCRWRLWVNNGLNFGPFIAVMVSCHSRRPELLHMSHMAFLYCPFLTVLEFNNWLLGENVHNLKLLSNPSLMGVEWHDGE